MIKNVIFDCSDTILHFGVPAHLAADAKTIADWPAEL